MPDLSSTTAEARPALMDVCPPLTHHKVFHEHHVGNAGAACLST